MGMERFLQPTYGPRFYRVDGEDFFEHRIDSRNGIGPRLATRTDKENHPKLWADHQASLTVDLNEGLQAPKRKKVK